MKTGIIAEYNPFHNGHKLHIEKTKLLTKSKFVIIAMSSNFVQRGEPAIYDKFLRAKMALENGADLVLELPSVYSSSGADVFAYGAVDLLNKTGIVDYLSFGTETGTLSDFEEVSDLLANETNDFKNELKLQLKKGLSYPSARLNALSAALNKNLSYLSSPNNILALEYLKSLKILESTILPFTIKREKSDFNSISITSEIASATAIRHAISTQNSEEAKKCIPENCIKYLSTLTKTPSLNDYSSIFHYILRTSSLKELSYISDITEGLENRIINSSSNEKITDIIEKLKTKRYTHAKLQRALLHIILNIKKSDLDLENGIKYIRVLGFRKDSSKLLSQLIDNSKVPVITNLKNSMNALDDNARAALEKEIIINNLYHLPLSGKINSDYTQQMIAL